MKDYSSCAAPDCKVKLVKVLHQAEEIFGTKENGKYTNITGQGYAYAGGIQLANGKCKMEREVFTTSPGTEECLNRDTLLG